MRAGAIGVIVVCVVGCRFRFDGVDVSDVAVPNTCQRNAYRVARVATFSTPSLAFVDVPGGVLDVEVAAGERWVLFASAAISTSGFGTQLEAVEVQYLLDGIVRTSNANQSEAAEDPRPWFYFDILDPGNHHVQVQLRDRTQTATIRSLQLVAFRAPTVTYSGEVAPAQQVMTTDVEVMTASFTPPSAATYLVIAAVSASEEPGSVDVVVTLRDHTGAAWPSFGHNRKLFRSFSWLRAVDLPAAPVTFSMFARSGGSTATVRDMRLLVLPANELGLQIMEVLGPTPVTTTGSTTVTTLTLPAPAQPVDRIVLQSAAASAGYLATTTSPVTVALMHGAEVGVQYDNHDNSVGAQPGAFVEAYSSADDLTFANVVSTADVTRTVNASEAVIAGLQLPCP